MLDNLQKSLELLQNKNQDQNEKLKKIFLNLSITNNQLLGFSTQIPNPQNLLNKVRPEVFNQILEFIDLKSYLRFRIISKRANQTVIQMIPNRITQIQQILMRRQQQLQELKEGNLQNELDQELLQREQNAQQGLNLLKKSDINEIKKMANPPILIVKIMTMICILIDDKFKEENSNWTDCLKKFENIQFLQLLISLDIANISDKQLKQLQNIHSISEEQVQRVSTPCLSFYLYIRALVEIRESKIYKAKRQQELFEKLIKRDQMALCYLQKMNQ